MKPKKAMAVQTLIKLLLVLAVVAILLYIIFNQFGVFSSSTKCEEKGGKCVSSSECNFEIVGECETGICCKDDIG